LAFIAGGASGSSLKRIDLASGQSYPIVDVFRFSTIAFQASWGPGDTILLASQTVPLQRLSASGGTPSPATVLRTAVGAFVHTSPQFLSDGRHFLYLERTSSRETHGIYVTSLDRPDDVVQLLRSAASARFAPSGSSGYLLRPRGGALVAQKVADNLRRLEGDVKTIVQTAGPDCSVSRNAILVFRGGPATENRLLWLNRSGKSQGELARLMANVGSPRLSPDNRRVVFNRLDELGAGSLGSRIGPGSCPAANLRRPTKAAADGARGPPTEVN
jgi:hypothetical protein